jgi:protein gp37
LDITGRICTECYALDMSTTLERYAVIGEHFYQPPRRASHDRVTAIQTDPTGIDWNKRIARECYIPQT